MAVPDAVRLLADQLEVYLAVFYPHMPAIAREAIVGRYALRPLKGRLPVVAGSDKQSRTPRVHELRIAA